MSLAPSERQALARIEEALRSSDPALAAKFATFTVRTRRGKIPGPKSRHLPWLWVWHVLPVMVVVAGFGLLILVLALYGQSPSGHGQSGASCSGSVSLVTACPPVRGK